ncbi:MAG: type II toxin-antitoxin system RelE/ParE family toxin [Kiritimatiellaeota bacterium]|nr:type II toxin-antitoxin system RelE/ParE family toxin [Kiritimatiellota bacterium]
MARLIWTEPALNDLDAIADYIALDKPDAAARLVQRVFASVEKLARFPKAGSIPPEISNLSYRQLVIPPCRVFYRAERDYVFIIFIMRAEQHLRAELLTERDKV